MASNKAPGRLEIVRAFVNTVDLEGGDDELGRATNLHAFLVERGLLAGDATVGSSDLDRARGLREAIRSLAEVNAGHEPDPESLAVLDRTADEAGLTVRLRPEGLHVDSPAEGISGAFGGLLAIVAEAMAAGTWQRLKACRSDTCRWLFYDHSRNRSGSWCSMAVCGNREKARAYRERHAGAST